MMKFIKLLLKILAGILLLGLLAFIILYLIYNQPLPEGQTGPKADALAQKMLKNINYDAYKNTRYLEWSFANGSHHYKWDKYKGIAQVQWEDYSVALHLKDSSKSIVTKKNTSLTQQETKDAYKKALDFFNNDSFWLVAPFKVFDAGTKRNIVKQKDGSEALLITYSSGGSTPGDSYLWKLNSNGFPKSYQMWVQIIPIGGLEASWSNWQVMQTGVFMPTSHELGFVTLTMGNVKAYN